MHTNSLPVGDRDEIDAGQPTPVFDNILRDRCEELIERLGITQKVAAQRMVVHPTALSKWLNGKPDGDVPALESAARAWIKRTTQRTNPQIKIFRSEPSEDMAKIFDLAVKSGTLQVICSRGGEGKTCGIQHYWSVPENTAATKVIDAYAWNKRPAGIRSEIFAQTPNNSHWHPTQGGQTKFLVEQYRSSGHLFIFDKSEALSWSALDWIVDFHEATACPVVLVGRPELEARLRTKKGRKMLDRVAYIDEVKIKNHRKFAAQMLADAMPEKAAELLELSATLVAQPGAGHALSNRLRIVKHSKGKVAEKFAALQALSPNAAMPLTPVNKQLEEGK